MVKITGFRMRRIVVARLAHRAQRVPALQPHFVERLATNLRHLHDTLEGTELRGRYWVWSGLLLGWAREGAILRHDSLDADFAVNDRDFHLLARSVPALVQAGFRCDRCFMNNQGVITELTFTRNGAKFDFFRMFPESGTMRYFMYAIRWNGILEMEACLPEQPKVPFSFVGRTWLKPQDHERELTAVYGSWQVPDLGWSYLNQPDIVVRRPSLHRHFDWPHGVKDLPEELLRPGGINVDNESLG